MEMVGCTILQSWQQSDACFCVPTDNFVAFIIDQLNDIQLWRSCSVIKKENTYILHIGPIPCSTFISSKQSSLQHRAEFILVLLDNYMKLELLIICVRFA